MTVPLDPRPICDGCGDAFVPQSPRWGTLCGACLSARLEVLLWRASGGVGWERKPMRRGAAIAEAAPAENERRRA